MNTIITLKCDHNSNSYLPYMLRYKLPVLQCSWSLPSSYVAPNNLSTGGSRTWCLPYTRRNALYISYRQLLEEVAHGHVTTCVSEFMRSLYGGFCTEKTIRIFSVLFSITPKELVSFESASGVESKYPVNPVQPLGHWQRSR